jgi:hypothetical protein
MKYSPDRNGNPVIAIDVNNKQIASFFALTD